MKATKSARRVVLFCISSACCCLVGGLAAAQKAPELGGAQSVKFKLSDVFGRKVSSADYAGVPVFLEFGACW